jgi:selenocysteine lyase/cysteine desulfurase
MFGKYDELLKLPNQNHFFIAEDRIPYKLQPGNVNYELAYGSIGIEDYLLELGAKDGTTPRQKMAAAFDQITQQEELLSASLLNYLTAKNNVRIIGETSHAARLRVPTISFVVEGVDSESIVSQIDKFNIGIRYGDFYARRLVQALGLEKNNGVVRVSMVHYNTIAEVEKLISKLDAIL